MSLPAWPERRITPGTLNLLHHAHRRINAAERFRVVAHPDQNLMDSHGFEEVLIHCDLPNHL
jgi:hypothetical protein